jgi:hypothetical protein
VNRLKEPLSLLVLLILGLGLRLIFISKFPTIPVSDFRALVGFAVHLKDDGLISRSSPWFWENFNVGMPLVLAGVLKLFPHQNPDTVCRVATGVINGLLPLLPFLIWRGVLSFRVRMLAGVLLAIWPGQIFFTGVIAQDNWCIFPAVALGAMAVRALVDDKKAWPIGAGLTLVAAVAMRQDMLAIVPLFLATIRVDLWRIRWRPILAGTAALVLGLLGLAAYRGAASGRFALSTRHGGLTVLGSYIAGSSYQGWVAPYPFIASIRPELLRDHEALMDQSLGLAFHEALRRPVFHALRILAMTGVYAIDGESSDTLGSSLSLAEVLPEEIHERGAKLAGNLKVPLHVEMALIQAFFLAAVMVGFRRRNSAILVLAAAVLMKYGIHAMVDFYGRFFYPATALEFLAIALAVEELLGLEIQERKTLLVRVLGAGVAFSLVLVFVAPVALASVQRHDWDSEQHVYRFSIEPPDHTSDMSCVVRQGRVVDLVNDVEATIRSLEQYDPTPGEKAVADCALIGWGEPRVETLQILDAFEPGGVGGRMVQRVKLDGREVFFRDIGLEPGSLWSNIPLGSVGAGTKRRVTIEMEAVHPERGEGWAYNGRVVFRMGWSATVQHLAMGNQTSQSSTLSGYASAGPQSAADGNIDGNFLHGSTTHTNREANAWWQVDLGETRDLDAIVIWNRVDCCSERLTDYWVFVSGTPFDAADTPETLQRRSGVWSSHQTSAPNPSTRMKLDGTEGRYVRVQLSGIGSLSLAEVQVFGK